MVEGDCDAGAMGIHDLTVVCKLGLGAYGSVYKVRAFIACVRCVRWVVAAPLGNPRSRLAA